MGWRVGFIITSLYKNYLALFKKIIVYFINLYIKISIIIVLLSQIYIWDGCMYKKFFLIIILFSLFLATSSCGKKADPYPNPTKTTQE